MTATGLLWAKAFALALATRQGGSAAALDLADVVRETRVHSAEVRAAQDGLKAARARVGQQNARRLPQVGVVGTATRYDDASTLNFGGQRVEVVPDHLETLTLQLDQVLDFTNQIGSAVSQARLFALASEYDLAAVEADASLAGTVAYYDLLRAEQSVRVAQAARSYSEARANSLACDTALPIWFVKSRT